MIWMCLYIFRWIWYNYTCTQAYTTYAYTAHTCTHTTYTYAYTHHTTQRYTVHTHTHTHAHPTYTNIHTNTYLTHTHTHTPLPPTHAHPPHTNIHTNTHLTETSVLPTTQKIGERWCRAEVVLNLTSFFQHLLEMDSRYTRNILLSRMMS